jgi:hypothetical protein
MIHSAKLEAQQLFILNVKGIPSREEPKTIFTSLSILIRLYLVEVMLWRSFQQKATLSVTLTLTVSSLPTPEK